MASRENRRSRKGEEIRYKRIYAARYDQRIRNFPDEAVSYGSRELQALATVWKEKQDEFRETGVFQEFLRKLQREWAIETGIIERLYTWDRGVTEVLISQGVDSSLIAHQSGMLREAAERTKTIIDDQLAIIEGLFPLVKGDQPLTEHFIRGLQARFTEHQDCTEALDAENQRMRIRLEKGKYKTLPNNPRRPNGELHEYCPPGMTQEEMQRLITWYREREAVTPAEVKAAWLHHRFTQIHPFQDGNGRVALALASLVFLKDRCFPLVIRDSDRKEYIEALETADAGDLRPLVDLFARRQKESILRALGLEQQAQQSRYAENIIGSALQMLKDKHDNVRRHVGRVYECADRLEGIARKRMQKITDDLNHKLGNLTPPLQEDRYSARLSEARSDSPQKHYFYNQIVAVARKFDYFANLERYRSWLRIAIKTEERFEFVVSIHGYGYAESSDSIIERFHDWLESALAIALGEWKRLLAA